MKRLPNIHLTIEQGGNIFYAKVKFKSLVIQDYRNLDRAKKTLLLDDIDA